MADPNNRNPLIIPGAQPSNRLTGCPKCGKDFTSRIIQGVVNSTCKSCGHKWQGGLPQTPVPPGQTLPPESYVPTVRFGKDTKGGDVEIRRRPNLAPDFRKGAPLPEPGEE